MGIALCFGSATRRFCARSALPLRFFGRARIAKPCAAVALAWRSQATRRFCSVLRTCALPEAKRFFWPALPCLFALLRNRVGKTAQNKNVARQRRSAKRQGNDSIFVDYDFGDCSAFVARSCILDTCRASRHGCNATSSRTQCLGSLWCIAALFGWFEIVVERTRFA